MLARRIEIASAAVVDEIDLLITDSGLDPQIAEELRQSGAQMELV